MGDSTADAATATATATPATATPVVTTDPVPSTTAATTTTDTKTTTTTTTATAATTYEEKKDEKSATPTYPLGAHTFLILGGTGFIGRNLVEYLIDNTLAKKIIIADKSMPATSYLNAKHKAYFKSNIVTFKQSDLAKDDHVKRVFKLEEKYDYVINLCGETRFGLTEHDYKIRCAFPAEKCAKAALEYKVQRFIEVSTAQVYSPKKKESDEESKIEPWTLQATYRLAAEDKVKEVDGLNWVILRPAICYGIGDLTGLSPRITAIATYQKAKEGAKWLWSKDLAMNVVHVRDMCSAIWNACTELKVGETYNVSDPTPVTQGDILGVLGSIFNVKNSYFGTALSTMAPLTQVADYANDKHVPEWTKMCQTAGIANTPLTPYINKELLYKKHLSVDGSKIVSDSKSFEYTVTFCKEAVLEQIDAFVAQNIFPPTVVLNKETSDSKDSKEKKSS